MIWPDIVKKYLGKMKLPIGERLVRDPITAIVSLKGGMFEMHVLHQPEGKGGEV